MDATEFGQYLKALRKEAKLSMAKLAEESGVSQPYISQIERGERGVPSPEILKKLSAVLGKPYIDLMAKAGFLPVETMADIDRVNELKGLTQTLQNTTHTIKDADLNLKSAKSELQQAEKELQLLEEIAKTRELKEFLKIHDITYRGKTLSAHDRERITGILEYLFAEERE